MFIDIFNTDKKFNLVYADPPWRYKVWPNKTDAGRSAESHYNTMSKEEIQNLPIKNITTKDCVLFYGLQYHAY